jgi:inhibitor of KinA
MTFAALGDSAVVVSFGTGTDDAALSRLRRLASVLAREQAHGIVEVVPAYATVAVFYEPARFAAGGAAPYESVCQFIAARVEPGRDAADSAPAGRLVAIPVCYGGEFGPDLEAVAAHSGLTAAAVIGVHAGADYAVHAIGFAPGFPYLGGLPAALHTPRRTTPRTSVPAGAVGIGGAQTGVYPLASPGGWNLIGRTPLKLFDAARGEPALLRTGDRVKFHAISAEEFATWR